MLRKIVHCPILKYLSFPGKDFNLFKKTHFSQRWPVEHTERSYNIVLHDSHMNLYIRPIKPGAVA
jgi:hypothetical protein